jgi:hypothetical protein
MPDGHSIDEFHSSAATLIGSLENKLDQVTRVGDSETIRLAGELRQLLAEIHGLLR